MNYEEKAPYSFAMKILWASGLMAIMALAGVFLFRIPQAVESAPFKAFALVVLFLAALSLWLFFKLRFGHDSKTLFAKTTGLRYSVEKKDVVKAIVLPKIPFLVGWGIRMWWWNGLTLAFVSQHKPALLIVKKTGLFKKVVFTVSNPKEFAKKAGLTVSR